LGGGFGQGEKKGGFDIREDDKVRTAKGLPKKIRSKVRREKRGPVN